MVVTAVLGNAFFNYSCSVRLDVQDHDLLCFIFSYVGIQMDLMTMLETHTQIPNLTGKNKELRTLFSLKSNYFVDKYQCLIRGHWGRSLLFCSSNNSSFIVFLCHSTVVDTACNFDLYPE